MKRAIDLVAISEIPEGEAHAFKVEGREIVVAKLEGYYYALEGMCTHDDLPLDGAEVEDGRITCDWHGAQFDLCTGHARTLPATKALRTYETRVEHGRLLLLLEE